MNQNNGGPAFPTEMGYVISGMSRRQWLAGLAMQGLISNHNITGLSGGHRRSTVSIDVALEREALVFKALQFADAMLNVESKVEGVT